MVTAHWHGFSHDFIRGRDQRYGLSVPRLKRERKLKPGDQSESALHVIVKQKHEKILEASQIQKDK